MNIEEYIPATRTPEFETWDKVKYSIATARQDGTYLTIKQLAMAIVAGLQVFHTEDDTTLVAKEMVDLTTK